MRILFVSRHEFIPIHGGIERCTDVLTTEFIRRGIDVQHLILVNSGIEQYRDDVKIHYFPKMDCKSIENRLFLDDLVRKEQIDILINQYGLHKAESSLFLSTESCKKISVLHSNPRMKLDIYNRFLDTVKFGRIKKVFSPLLKLRYKRSRVKYYTWLKENSDAIVVLSEQYRKQFVALKDSVAIPNSVKIPEGNNTDFPKKENSLLFVGRLERIEKSPHLLIQAWAKVCHSYPDWKLEIVGDGPDRRWLEEQALKLGAINIAFHGFCNSFSYYKKSPIFCLSSQNEGFGMVLIEAMAHYCVPIAFNSFAAAADIIDDNLNGCLIQPFDIDKYSKAIRFLIDNEKHRKQMAECAYVKSKKYAVDCIGDKWVSLFSSLLK